MKTANTTAHGATFDPTGTYRYALWRTWNTNLPPITFVMLNPSTADGEHDDPTVRRCLGFARAWGFGVLVIVNLFALRAASPVLLRRAEDPVGPDNDRHLRDAVARAATVVLAWGDHGAWRGRDRAICSLLAGTKREAAATALCLGRTRLGQPRHPLYVRRDAAPQPFGDLYQPCA